MGGADPQNYILKVLNNIKNYVLQQNIIVNIIIGYSNKNYNTITQFIDDITNSDNIAANSDNIAANNDVKSKNFIVYFNIDFNTLIKLYLNSDLAIGSLSITAYERLFIKIPQICIKIAENQLIQELEVFNITNIDNILEKMYNYKTILEKQLEYTKLYSTLYNKNQQIII